MEPINRRDLRVPLDVVRSVVSLSRLVRTLKIDLIHSNTQRGGLLGIMVNWLTGVKFVWTLNDVGLIFPVKFLTLFPDAVTCVSHAMYNALEGWPRKHFRIIYNGVVAEDLDPGRVEKRRLALRRNLAIPPNDLVIGNVSRLTFWKGIHCILEALPQVALRIPNIWFVQIGDIAPGYDDYSVRLEELRQATGFPSRIRFLGFQQNPQQFYPMFDLFVHVPLLMKSGHCEAFGMTVAEAMAYRLPVIVSRTGGLPEVVEEQATGLLVSPAHPDSLANAIRTLLSDPDARQRMGLAGQARYRRLFTQEREVHDFEELYQEVMGS